MHLTLFLIVINTCSVKAISAIDLELGTTHVTYLGNLN